VDHILQIQTLTDNYCKEYLRKESILENVFAVYRSDGSEGVDLKPVAAPEALAVLSEDWLDYSAASFIRKDAGS
jgi:hypothetical protein